MQKYSSLSAQESNQYRKKVKSFENFWKIQQKRVICAILNGRYGNLYIYMLFEKILWVKSNFNKFAN